MVLNKLAEYLRDKDMLPAIAFVFSRKNVEICANEITTNLLEDDSKIPYTIRRECEQIIRKFPNFKEYLELPEYNELVALLEKGIGIHHSGMIPVLREIVELMISKRYIKLLFATESFAIGLDCPIKTAIFTSLTKFDGSSQRFLQSHEYTQMAGRAGRRGIDTVGHVVHCNNLFRCPTINEYKGILCGKPQKLVSKFKISYQTVLSLIKNDKTDIKEYVKFVEKSMLSNELEISKTNSLKLIQRLENDIMKKEEMIGNSKTPVVDIQKYIELSSCLSMFPNKKRKEVERVLFNIKEDNRWFDQDLKRYQEYLELDNEIKKEKSVLSYSETYIGNQIHKICILLEKEGMIEKSIDDEIVFLKKGKIASNIAEIHPIIAAIITERWDYFKEFTSKQLIGLFSCFTDIKVSEENRRLAPHSKDEFLKNKIKDLSSIVSDFQAIENMCSLETGINYDNMLIYDLIDVIQEWTECQTEEQSKYFIQTQIYDKEISIGEFIKSVLKIATITKEFMSISEQLGEVELLFKLTQIEPMILKYVTTAQSLYV
jgi:superfamily II RNA helicase